MWREIPLLGVLTLRGFPCWDPASLETRCDERPNDHLLLFVSKSTKQHLFLWAGVEFAVMDEFLKPFSWRLDGIFTACVTFMISTSSVRRCDEEHPERSYGYKDELFISQTCGPSHRYQTPTSSCNTYKTKLNTSIITFSVLWNNTQSPVG